MCVKGKIAGLLMLFGLVGLFGGAPAVGLLLFAAGIFVYVAY